MATRKAQNTAPAIPEVSWFVTGRGKSANYYAAVPEAIAASGTVVALVAKSGAVTYGTLRAPAAELDDKATARIPEGHAIMTFDRDSSRMTAELRAENAAKKAEARAAFLRSEAGIAQAARIAERAQRKAEAEAAGIPDTRTVTVTVDPAIMAPAAPAATEAPSLAAQAEALKAAGFTAAEILAALSTVNPPATPAASKPATRKPAASKPISLSSLNAAAGKRTVK